MTPDLEQKLAKEFPKIFTILGKPDTCMRFGIECGDGWYDILYMLCHTIQTYCDHNGFQVVAEQIKEKFGTLRFYHSGGGDDTIGALIWMAELLSGRTCEHCGDKGKMGGETWVKCLCDECRNEPTSKS